MLHVILAILTGVSLVPSSAQELPERQLRQVFAEIAFDQPLFLWHAGDASNRVFVVERAGIIKVLSSDPQGDHFEGSKASIFLDLRDRVNRDAGEAGLLSVAFHPRYATTGLFYVYYTHVLGGNLLSRVSEFSVSADPDSGDPESERILWVERQPAGNHNGGQLAFGPDGMLYIGLGDGGGSNDRFANGQDPTTWLGAILRVDVDHRTQGFEYGIPPDNPFVGNADGWRPEIWAYGLRNPWRFSFDRRTGDLWTGDVGQGAWEEVDLIAKGGNYGWNTMEGFHCFRPSSDCDQEGLELPVVEYGHSLGRSITGGYVYRAARLGVLDGVYIYGDFVTRRIWGLRYEDGKVTANDLIATSPSQISSFGEDESGEVYIVGYDGRIYVFEPLPGETSTAIHQSDDGAPRDFSLAQNFPNPFNPVTRIPLVIPAGGNVELAVYDLLGRRVRGLLLGVMPAGPHTVQWDGRDDDGRRVASGVYVYRLQMRHSEKARKMVLIH